ncbi:sex peptide receptor isoform X2 [Nasonia vitripennis]|uniref:G-protein coupled receptors family 1 profile domain-containing protein n=1 Tax=Nasonia vitripennis TaxID=7425 RepID=A0A7M7IW65_NASVI|nr:sex peptide receptor isoform X2 [Nasonia vitripennis]
MNEAALQLGQHQQPLAHQLSNYTELLRRLNITEEDLDYVNNFGSSAGIGGTGGTGGTGGGCSCGPCHCGSLVRRFAASYRAYHGYVALLVCGFGTLANLLNVAVLTRKELRRAPINRILTGLAAADVLVMLEYVPFAIYEYIVLPERRHFPYGWAVFVLFHMHFSQLLHTISIALTLSLAVWRYIAVRFPQCSRSWCTPARCRLALLCSLLAAGLACAPSYFVFGIREQKLMEENGPVVLYHVDASRGPSSDDDRGLLYRLNFWLLGVLVKLLPCFVLTVISCRLIQALYKAKTRRRLLRPLDGQLTDTPATGGRSERRADRTTRMLVAVLLLFLITEIPQGVLGLLSALLGDCFFRSCYHSLGEIMDILALFNGAVNFILYCSMSRQFRTTFGRLFKPSIVVGKWQPACTHQTDIQSTYV